MPSIEDILRQGDEMQANEATTFPPGLPQSVIDYILSHPSFAEGEPTTTSPPESWPYGTWDNPLLQPGEEGAIVGSRPVPGSADQGEFSDNPARMPGQADDRAMSIADLLGFQGQTGGAYGGQTTTYYQPQFQDFSGLARALSQYRWAAGGNESQAIPEQYSGDIPPTLLPDFMKMIRNGVPPDVAHAIMTQPSFAEGQRPHEEPRYVPFTPYRGGEVDPRTGRQADPVGPYAGDPPPKLPPGVIDPLQGLNDRLVNKRLNLPTWEGHTPGEDDSLGYYRLPNGQYVPRLSPDHRDPLQYYRQRGDPNSFYWNPQPGTWPVPDYYGGP